MPIYIAVRRRCGLLALPTLDLTVPAALNALEPPDALHARTIKEEGDIDGSPVHRSFSAAAGVC